MCMCACLHMCMRVCRKASVVERPVCEYGLHVAVSRTRLAMLNDPYRNKVYLNLLQKVRLFRNHSRCDVFNNAS